MKDIRLESKGNLKKNYYNIIIVSILTLVVSLSSSLSVFSIEEILGLKIITYTDELFNFIFKQNKNFLLGNNILEKVENKFNMIEGHSGGIFTILNSTKGKSSFFTGLTSAINEVVFNNVLSLKIVFIISLFMFLLYRIFIRNYFLVSKNRFYMDYQLKNNRKWTNLFNLNYFYNLKNIIKIMTLKKLSILLGPSRYYSYKMIPYILAENPSISRKEAFERSREITKNRKFKIFKMDLYFLLLRIASILTLGLAGIFYINPYRELVFSSFYIEVSKGLIKSEDEKVELEISQINYSLQEYIEIFFIAGFVGWLWEVLMYLAKYKTFINRGTLKGPWLPIYGFGSVFMVYFSSKEYKSLGKVFLNNLLIGMTVEYFSHYLLEKIYNLNWWDYRGFFMNINERICLEWSLIFAIAGTFLVYYIGPRIKEFMKQYSYKRKRLVNIVLVGIFIVDFLLHLKTPNKGFGIAWPIN